MAKPRKPKAPLPAMVLADLALQLGIHSTWKKNCWEIVLIGPQTEKTCKKQYSYPVPLLMEVVKEALLEESDTQLWLARELNFDMAAVKEAAIRLRNS